MDKVGLPWETIETVHWFMYPGQGDRQTDRQFSLVRKGLIVMIRRGYFVMFSPLETGYVSR